MRISLDVIATPVIGAYIMVLIVSAVLAVAALAGVTALVRYILRARRREQRLASYIEYVRSLSHGNYDLRIADNEEGNLSILANEIYKIAVQMREQTEQSKKESENLSRALADISHQIRTPLTSMQITLDNLSENPDMDEATRRAFFRSVRTQIDRTSQLATTLLQLAKFDSGTISLSKSEFAAAGLFGDVREALEVLAEASDVELVLEGDLNATLYADYAWEREALLNIVKNAIEHSHPHGEAPEAASPEAEAEQEQAHAVKSVTLSVEDGPLFTVLRVRDEGEGIPPEELKHVFERFYKPAGSDKESFGIGLSFAKTVIEADGGVLTVDSVPGKGTSFTIRFGKKK
ncbi:MAG: HAMP domain-containing histidine kinase [Lachnospiraceae bacterium]|nr:HAMP domain-containing histidine kinase [Lachnospiraceae bacterium]